MRRAPVLSCLLWTAACGQTETFIDASVPAELEVSASAVTFGEADCGSTPEAETIDLGNSGTEAVTWSAEIDGTGFTIEGDTEGTVAPGGTGSITIRPDPIAATATADEDVVATLVITSSAGDFDVDLAITPRGGAIVLSPTTADFGTTPVGTTATDVAVMISNTGNAPVDITIVDEGDEFSVSYPGGPGAVTLAAGGNFTATTGFAPVDTAGTRTATAAITIDGVHCATATEVPLVGISSTGTLSFGAFPQMTADCGAATPPTGSLMVTNTSATSSVTVTAADATGGFVVTSTVPFTIPPLGTATIDVRPPASVIGTDLGGATKSGTLSFTTNETDNPTHTSGLTSTVVGANLVFTGPSDTTPITTLSFAADSLCPASQQVYVRNTGNAPVEGFGSSGSATSFYLSSGPSSSIDGGASTSMSVAVMASGSCTGGDSLQFVWSSANVCTTTPAVLSASFSITGMSGCFCS